jgi:hypothetical protein
MTEGPEAWRWARGVASTPVAAAFRVSAGEFSKFKTWIVFDTGSGLSGPGEASSPLSPFRTGGVLRVLDPDTCKLVDTLDEAPVPAWFQAPAVADLDGDGIPEIVAQAQRVVTPGQANYASSGELVAWKFDGSRFRIHRRATVAGAPENDLAYTGQFSSMAGPSVADLDDDGKPEIVIQGRVYDNELRRLTGQAPPTVPLMMSVPAAPDGSGGGPYIIQLDVIADLDGDRSAELVYGNAVFTWNKTARKWDPWPAFAPPVPLAVGNAVVTRFPSLESEGPAPHVVVVGPDGLRIQTATGRILRAFPVLGQQRGAGAPSIANIDADADPEILIGSDFGVFVYDLQCDTATPGPECGRDATPVTAAPALPRAVRWADRPPTPNWDYMGATTFDFDGDGKLEVLYADECFLRAYNGETGNVIYSHWRPSRTAAEVPIVVGTSGGADTVIAIGLHTSKFCAQATGTSGTPPYDPQFAGLPCRGDGDCGNRAGACAAGLCRCQADADCCGAGEDCTKLGFGCHPGPDDKGKTCRAIRVPDPSGYSANGSLEEGIDVLADAYGRWSLARPVWNQDAYTAAGVRDNGTIPKTSDVIASWKDPGWSSFRSNTPGAARAGVAPDLTVRNVRVRCGSGSVTAFVATACNRGSRASTRGQVVRFSVDGQRVCQGTTDKALEPGECADVECSGAASIGKTVVATVNPDQTTPECGAFASNVSKPFVVACP